MFGTAAWLKDYYGAVKRGSFRPMCPFEKRLRQITKNDLNALEEKQIQEVVQLSFSKVKRQVLFTVLRLRLKQGSHKHHSVFKSLVLVEAVLIRGCEKCIIVVRSELMDMLICLLQRTEFRSDSECGIGMKISDVVALLEDPLLLTANRIQYKFPLHLESLELGKGLLLLKLEKMQERDAFQNILRQKWSLESHDSASDDEWQEQYILQQISYQDNNKYSFYIIYGCKEEVFKIPF
eukprot:TRINITY_DN2065_c0_g1_i5.p1 TRINITY_DN2065_c0_g1~~TRINITY_DN2065_c0_g1_i5.p1  ORF type:complete len:272 (+),score=13.15 TRINITY_DN2065_c0_g1_i5:110-817(+)